MLRLPHPPRMPRHLAVIMDGNGRWAERRRRPRMHRPPRRRARGQRLHRLLPRATASQALTLFAFSSENWGRPGGGSRRADEAVPARARPRSRRTAPPRRARALHRRARALRRRRSSDAMARAEALTARQHAPAPDHRRQLRRPLGHRPGRARAGRATSPPAGCAPEAIDEAALARARRPGRPAAAGPVHPHRRRHCASAISCSGSWPTPNCGSPRRCGPSSMRPTLRRALDDYRQPRTPLRPDRRAGGAAPRRDETPA